MLVGIHQLHYLPWLRYFEKIARSDVFVVLDNIQFNKGGWQNRNKIKSSQGAQVLTVPIGHGLGQTLDEVVIGGDGRWARKHFRSLEQAYGASPYWKLHKDFLQDCYARKWVHLNDLNRHMLAYWVGALGIETEIVYASSLDVPGVATERLIHLVKAVGGTQYYSGAYALEVYLDGEALAEAGIELVLQAWRGPEYPQRFGDFVPDLAIVDLLMQCGPDSLARLMEGGAV